MPTNTTTAREPGTATRSCVQALLDDLQAAHADGRKLADELAAAVADLDDDLAGVTAIVAAVVRNSEDPVAIVDAGLAVRMASPAADELIAAHADGPPERRSLRPVLPPGGAAEVRRCLAPELGGDVPAPDAEFDAEDPRPTVVHLQARLAEVTVERVCARRRPLGGLWGGWLPDDRRGGTRPDVGCPRFPYGLVTFRPLDGGRDSS